MKAQDITVGEAYCAEYEYNRRGKVTVLEVPVVRMVMSMGAGGKRFRRPYRQDGRADGARVKVARTGGTVDVALVHVLRPWGADDDAREARRDECIVRVAAARAKLAELGMPNGETWRGEGLSVDDCTVALPFVECEAFLKRIDPVEVVKDAIRLAQGELLPGEDLGEAAIKAAGMIRERWAAGFELAEPPAADDDVAF